MEKAEPLPGTTTEVEAIVIEAVAKIANRPVSDVSPSHHLQADLGLDSLESVELQMALEDRFEITIDDDDLQKLAKVRDVTEYVAGRYLRP